MFVVAWVAVLEVAGTVGLARPEVGSMGGGGRMVDGAGMLGLVAVPEVGWKPAAGPEAGWKPVAVAVVVFGTRKRTAGSRPKEGPSGLRKGLAGKPRPSSREDCNARSQAWCRPATLVLQPDARQKGSYMAVDQWSPLHEGEPGWKPVTKQNLSRNRLPGL